MVNNFNFNDYMIVQINKKKSSYILKELWCMFVISIEEMNLSGP